MSKDDAVFAFAVGFVFGPMCLVLAVIAVVTGDGDYVPAITFGGVGVILTGICIIGAKNGGAS